MYFFIDESERDDGGKNVLGGILLPKNKVPDFERDFVSLRIEHKLFGEFKWAHVDQYYERYFDFLDLFFNEEQATYHSICFRQSDAKYRAAYYLIRTVSWKLFNAGITTPLNILFDNDGSLGRLGTTKIKEIAIGDQKFRHELEFCNQGHSHVMGALQIADLLTGAVCATVNKARLREEPQKMIDFLTERNQGIPLDFTEAKLPKLDQRKIHYFDPDNRP